jgi:four helix bundle protein
MRKKLIENNPILKHTILFSLMIIDHCAISDASRKFITSKQLFRSAPFIDANVMEAQHAGSKAGCMHKIKIAAKEANETQCRLTSGECAPGYSGSKPRSNKLQEIQKIINAIPGIAKRNNPFSYFLSFFTYLKANCFCRQHISR